MKHDVALIILNYNSSSYTIECVQSIRSFATNVDYKIIIYDNGSRSQDYEKLLSLTCAQVEIKRGEVNLGFASGNVEAIKHVDAAYFFFLNNDTLFLNDVLDPLYNFCSENKTVGICAPQLFNKDGSLHATFDYFPTIATKIVGLSLVKLFSKRDFPVKDLVRTEPVKVELVSGSAMFIRKSAYDAIGGFDTTFFLYCEEEDLALRMQKNKYAVYVVPAAKVKHIGGGSTERKFILEKEFYISFNYFYKKHYGSIKAFLLRTLLFIKVGTKYKRKETSIELAKFIISNPKPNASLRHRKEP